MCRKTLRSNKSYPINPAANNPPIRQPRKLKPKNTVANSAITAAISRVRTTKKCRMNPGRNSSGLYQTQRTNNFSAQYKIPARIASSSPS